MVVPFGDLSHGQPVVHVGVIGADGAMTATQALNVIWSSAIVSGCVDMPPRGEERFVFFWVD